jgi:adenylyltransferase/sulfurtransferase
MMSGDGDRIGAARFALIGCGGLGGPVACALAAAGAGELVLCDHDTVELSNLQRQIQFRTADVGRSKPDALADELARRGHPRRRTRLVPERFTREAAARVLAGASVAIDGSDDVATKFAVSDACVAFGVPFVIASVVRYNGQVLAAIPRETGCYRCLFEAAPVDDEPPSCAQAGVLGAAVAVIAGHAAHAALRLADRRAPDAQLLVFDDLASAAPPRRVSFRRRPDCPACGRPATLDSSAGGALAATGKD